MAVREGGGAGCIVVAPFEAPFTRPAGKQGKLFEEGNTYLDREFPELDKLIRARIVNTP